MVEKNQFLIIIFIKVRLTNIIANVYRLKRKYSQSLNYHIKIREKSHIEVGKSLLEVALSYHYLRLNNHSIPL